MRLQQKTQKQIHQKTRKGPLEPICHQPAPPWLQVEGAFVFGLGMMTTEEVVIDPNSGRLLTDSTWTYKIPHGPLCTKPIQRLLPEGDASFEIMVHSADMAITNFSYPHLLTARPRH